MKSISRGNPRREKCRRALRDGVPKVRAGSNFSVSDTRSAGFAHEACLHSFPLIAGSHAQEESEN